MKEKITRWLIIAHKTFPVALKFAARGAILGSIGGFLLSYMYSMLFGIPFGVVGSLFMLFFDDGLQGVAKIGFVLIVPIAVAGLLILQIVLPSTLIGTAGGALTGLGVKWLTRLNKVHTFQTELYILLFWVLVISILGYSFMPTVLPGTSVEDFRQWVFIYIPSAIFALTMGYVAKVSASPFFNFNETKTP